MPLLPINPSPCIPGVGEGGIGTPWGGGGRIGFGLDADGGTWTGKDGAGGKDGKDGSGKDGTTNRLDGVNGADGKATMEQVNALHQALKELQQKLSHNFSYLQTVLAALDAESGGGFFVLRSTLYQGATAVAERFDWGDPGFFPSGETIEVVDYYLNDGESIELGTKIEVRVYQGVFVVANAYCTPSDTI